MSVTGNNKWLQVMSEDAIPQLHTVTHCMTLCDLKNDNYIRLIVVDITIEPQPQATLKVFRGTKLVNERALTGIPCAIESFYTDSYEPRTPIIAVAISDHILFYRNLKPYFKYTLPSLEVDTLEQELWRKLPLYRNAQQAAILEQFKNLDLHKLTRQSQRLLQLKDAEEKEKFIEKFGDVELKRHTYIMSMKRLHRISSNNEQQPAAHLVLATEHGQILIIEAQCFGVLYKAEICSYETTPSLLAVHGTYETDFCIVIASRYGCIYLLRKSTQQGQEICRLPQPATDLLLLPVEQTIVVCSMTQRLSCYSKKGKQIYCLQLPARPNCMIPITLAHLGLTLSCVALDNGQVHFYLQRQLVDVLQLNEAIVAMCFGRMGWEEHVLTLITCNGNIIIKILKRQAEFDGMENPIQHNLQHQLEMNILNKPKKSSIFLEQAKREKENVKSAYGSFQLGLWRLRHLAAKNTIAAMQTLESPLSSNSQYASVKMTAEICGNGPDYCLYLIIQNLSQQQIAQNLQLLLHADRRHYILTKSHVNLPCILSQIPLRIDFEVTSVLHPFTKLPPETLTMENAQIRVMLLYKMQTKPLIAAIITMPQTELNS